MVTKIKQTVRRAVGLLYLYTGLFHFVRFLNNIAGNRLTIITYHRVTGQSLSKLDASLPYLFTTVESFENQLRFIKKWYTVLSFQDLKKNYPGNKLPSNSLIITFDDGYEDNYRNAYPVLKKLDLTATFFLTADKIGSKDENPFWWDQLYYYLIQMQQWGSKETLIQRTNSEVAMLFEEFEKNPSGFFARVNEWDSKKVDSLLKILHEKLQTDHEKLKSSNPIMSWNQIASMHDHGQFGSHTCSHDNPTMIDKIQLKHELYDSKQIIEENTRQQVNSFSYPCGNIDSALKKAVQEAGYEYAVTTEIGVNDLSDTFSLKRINMWEASSLSLHGGFSKGYFALKLTGF